MGDVRGEYRPFPRGVEYHREKYRQWRQCCKRVGETLSGITALQRPLSSLKEIHLGNLEEVVAQKKSFDAAAKKFRKSAKCLRRHYDGLVKVLPGFPTMVPPEELRVLLSVEAAVEAIGKDIGKVGNDDIAAN